MDASTISNQLAAERLAAEIADVTASIELVASGVASGVTLSGLHFGRKIAELLRAQASEIGVDVESDFWSDDALAADVHVKARWPHA
jgi:hypothetical protein